MTTIAANLESMAADTRLVGDVLSSVSKVRRYGGRLIGVAGDMNCIAQFWEWADAGFPKRKKPQLPEGLFDAIELDAEGLWAWEKSLCRYRVRDSFHAIGSGAASAKTAMYLKRTPKQAVEIASVHDESTGGDVEVFCLRK